MFSWFTEKKSLPIYNALRETVNRTVDVEIEPLTPISALLKIIEEGPLAALNKEYSPPIKYLQLAKNILNNKKDVAKIASGTVVGGFAAYINVFSSFDAAAFFVKQWGLNEKEMARLIFGLGATFATSAIITTALLNGYFMVSMIDAYTEKNDRAQSYLKGRVNDSFKQVASANSRKVMDLILAACSLLPNFDIAKNAKGQGGSNAVVNQIFSALAAIAELPGAREGVASIELPTKQSPAVKAQQCLAKYLHQGIDNLLQLPIAEINSILENIKNKTPQAALLSFFQLLKPSEKDNSKQEQDEIIEVVIHQDKENKAAQNLLPQETESKMRVGLEVGSVVASILSGIGLSFEARNDARKTSEILGWAAFVLSAIPLYGLGYRSGKEVGSGLFSGKKTVVHLAFPKGKPAADVLAFMITLLSEMTTVQVSFESVEKFGKEFYFPTWLTDALAYIFEASALVGAPIASFYFVSLLFDELLRYVALHCCDENIQRLITVIDSMQNLGNTFGAMTENNFKQIFVWLVEHHPELATQYKFILKQRMKATDYQAFIHSLSTENIQHQYSEKLSPEKLFSMMEAAPEKPSGLGNDKLSWLLSPCWKFFPQASEQVPLLAKPDISKATIEIAHNTLG